MLVIIGNSHIEWLKPRKSLVGRQYLNYGSKDGHSERVIFIDASDGDRFYVNENIC